MVSETILNTLLGAFATLLGVGVGGAINYYNTKQQIEAENT